MKLPLKCQCGKVKGELVNIGPSKGNHIVCMCIDCQTYARYLNAHERVLDENGGTHIFQVTPPQVKITEGKENISLLRLSPTGTRRFFASCCNTPIANTISKKMAFNGIVQDFIDFDNATFSKEEALGPIKYRCMAKYGKGEIPKGSYPEFPKFLTFKIILNLLKGKVFKSYLPHAFYEEDSEKPIGDQIVLSKEQREEIRSKC